MRSDLQRALDTHSALKIISGLTNYDPQRVVAVVKAADQGGATLVDIAADADLVRLAKAATTLPICVSAVKPEAFLAPVAAGAAGVGVGSAVNKLDNALAMVAVVRQLVESLQAVRIAAVR